MRIEMVLLLLQKGCKQNFLGVGFEVLTAVVRSTIYNIRI
jgi:hypothetical protein